MRLLAAAAAVSSALVFCGGLALVRRAGVPIRLSTSHPLALPFIRNSVSMRFGHSLHQFLAPLITNNALAALPSGAVSHYGYAQRVLQILYNVATGPSARMYASHVSAMWSGGNAAAIRAALKSYLRVVPPLMLAAAAAGYLLLPSALRLVAGSSLSAGDIDTIRLLFLFLTGWYLVMTVESAFTMVSIAERNSRIFIKTNAIFGLLYLAIVLLARGRLGVYAVPLGLFLAQSANLFTYSRAALRRLDRADANGGKLHG